MTDYGFNKDAEKEFDSYIEREFNKDKDSREKVIYRYALKQVHDNPKRQRLRNLIDYFSRQVINDRFSLETLFMTAIIKSGSTHKETAESVKKDIIEIEKAVEILSSKLSVTVNEITEACGLAIAPLLYELQTGKHYSLKK